MGTILIIVLLIVLLGGGGGYYGYNRYGGSGLGGALGLVLIVLIVVMADRWRAVQPPLMQRIGRRMRAASLRLASGAPPRGIGAHPGRVDARVVTVVLAGQCRTATGIAVSVELLEPGFLRCLRSPATARRSVDTGTAFPVARRLEHPGGGPVDLGANDDTDTDGERG